jgi:site-specific recombinase XerD
MSTATILSPVPEPLRAAFFTPTPKTAQRVLEFFTGQINNDHTRKAYLNAARRFAEWCGGRGLGQLADVQGFHVAAFVEELEGKLSAPTVKQHLAALRMLFDWLVNGQILEVNPAGAVRGPQYVVDKRKTTVLTAEEARELLDSIAITKKTGRQACGKVQEPALVGLRDRALIGVMVYTFARVNAALHMKVRDYFMRGPRPWVRLQAKGGKEHAVPCHHNLEQYLDEYIAAAGIAGDLDGPLFRTTGRKTGTQHPMWQQDAYRMIQRRAVDASIKTRIGNHTFRATGITAYLRNKGTLETAQFIANHQSPRTTKLYDPRHDEISLDEVERIAI